MVTAAVALRATACRACACVAPCGGARVRAAAAPARTVGTERRRGGGVWVRCFVFRVVARPGRDTARRRRRARRGPGARPRAVRLRAMGNPRMGAIYAGPRSRLDSVSSRSAARAPRGHPGPRSRGRLHATRTIGT